VGSLRSRQALPSFLLAQSESGCQRTGSRSISSTHWGSES
jgi:hypothetical protein